jgi:hypothetical protein
MTRLYLLKLVFPKFDPLTVTGMVLCVDLGPKCQNFILLSLRLGIEFSFCSLVIRVCTGTTLCVDLGSKCQILFPLV